MPEARRLIIGLGNPGTEYAGTRHNIGFDVVDALASRAGITFKKDKSNALLGWGRLEGRSVGLAKPLTYMNRSGSAVQQLVRYYGIDLDHLIVVVDDLNLQPGQLRIRQRGSAGGHNGIQDIIDILGTDAFPRLRIGIGSQFSRGHQADYVLSRFSRAEQPVMQEAMDKAVDAVIVCVGQGVTAAMNTFNG